jgi:hypothetical protein
MHGPNGGLEPGVEAARWERMMVAVAAMAILAVTSLTGWIVYLRFCRFLVSHTNDSSSLRDAAIAAKAFRGAAPSAVAQVVAKMVALIRR